MIRVLSNLPAARVVVPSPAVARAAADGGSTAGFASGFKSPQAQARGAAEPATCSTCPRWVPCKVPVVGICTRDEPAVKTIASHGCARHPKASPP